MTFKVEILITNKPNTKIDVESIEAWVASVMKPVKEFGHLVTFTVDEVSNKES